MQSSKRLGGCVYPPLPLRLVPSRSGTHILGVKTMWLLSPLCRTPRGNLANALAINCNIWAISIWLRFIWPKSRSATPFTLFYPPPLQVGRLSSRQWAAMTYALESSEANAQKQATWAVCQYQAFLYPLCRC